MEAQDDPRGQEKIRNTYIDARLSLINTNYKAFVNQVNKEKQSLDTGAGIGALISDLVVSVTPAASTKAIWGAVSAGFTGTQLTINENIYYQKTISALLAAMDAGRAKARLAIEEGKRRGVDEYGLVDANIDLNTYEAAGSFLKALDNIQTDADKKADEYENKISTVKFWPGDEPLKKRIRAWIDKDPNNDTALQKWLAERQPPPDSQFPAIWVESAPTDELKAAIIELKIPETQTPIP